MVVQAFSGADQVGSARPIRIKVRGLRDIGIGRYVGASALLVGRDQMARCAPSLSQVEAMLDVTLVPGFGFGNMPG
jgi:hypothetical protein